MLKCFLRGSGFRWLSGWMYSFALYLNPYKRAFVYLYCCLGQGWWMCASTVVQWISASVLSDAQKWHLHFKTLFLRLFWHPRHQSLNLFFQEWLLPHNCCKWFQQCRELQNRQWDALFLENNVQLDLKKKSLFCSQSFSLILVQGRKKTVGTCTAQDITSFLPLHAPL